MSRIHEPIAVVDRLTNNRFKKNRSKNKRKPNTVNAVVGRLTNNQPIRL